MSPRYDNDDREGRYFKSDTRTVSKRASDGNKYDSKGRYESEYGGKRTRYECARKTPGTLYLSLLLFFTCISQFSSTEK